MKEEDEIIPILESSVPINKYFTEMNFDVSKKKRSRIAISYFIRANPNIDLTNYLTDFRLFHEHQLITKQDETTIAIKNLIILLEKNNLAPNTINGYVSDIKQLHDYYHMKIDDIDWKQINKLKKHTGKVFFTESPTKDQLQRILANATALDKAYFLTILSTGKRPDEILKIELNDLHLNEKPPRIAIRTLSNSKKRRTPSAFITEECKEAIETYLTQRTMFINRIINSHLDIKNKEQFQTSKKLFCIDERTVRRHWNKLLKKANLNETTKHNEIERHKYNHYSLKHYFRAYLGNPYLAEYLMGHTDIRNLYNTKQEHELAQDYLTFSKNLYIYGKPDLDEELKNELTKKDEQIQRLITADEMRKQDLLKMEGKLTKLTEFMNRLQVKEDDFTEINKNLYRYDAETETYYPATGEADSPPLNKNKKPLKLIKKKSIYY